MVILFPCAKMELMFQPWTLLFARGDVSPKLGARNDVPHGAGYVAVLVMAPGPLQVQTPDAGQRIRFADDRHVHLREHGPDLAVLRIEQNGRDEVRRGGKINGPIKERRTGIVRAKCGLDLAARQSE